MDSGSKSCVLVRFRGTISLDRIEFWYQKCGFSRVIFFFGNSNMCYGLVWVIFLRFGSGFMGTGTNHYFGLWPLIDWLPDQLVKGRDILALFFSSLISDIFDSWNAHWTILQSKMHKKLVKFITNNFLAIYLIWKKELKNLLYIF